MCNARLKQYSIYIIVLFIFSLLHYFFHEFYLSDSTFLLSKCNHRLLFDVLKRIIQINVFHDIFVTVDMIMIIFNILKINPKYERFSTDFLFSFLQRNNPEYLLVYQVQHCILSYDLALWPLLPLPYLADCMNQPICFYRNAFSLSQNDISFSMYSWCL